MSDTVKINEMDAERVFWALFDALGYCAGTDEDDCYFYMTPDGNVVDGWANEDYFAVRGIGESRMINWNWERDAGAALKLCKDIARERRWDLTFEYVAFGAIEPGEAAVTFYDFIGLGLAEARHTVSGDDALAMSKLALMAFGEGE